MKKTVLAVAQDAAPSRCFQLLGEVAGESLLLMVADGKSFLWDDRTICTAVADADAVLIGMSSSPKLAIPELVAAREAIAQGKLLLCYGDSFGCFNRSWFYEIADGVSVYFGATSDDPLKVKQVLKNAACYTFGNPLDEALAFSHFTREEARKHLGVAEKEVMVLAPGTKTVTENAFMWAMLIDALMRFAQQTNRVPKLFLAPHPGDRTLTAIDAKGEALELYQEFINRASIPVSILNKAVLSSSQALVGSDLVVAFGGSIGREAGFKQIPVLSIGTEIAFARVLEETGERLPEAVRLGLAALVDANSQQIAGMVAQLLDPSLPLRAKQLERQKQHCVAPPYEGFAAGNMWQVISDLL